MSARRKARKVALDLLYSSDLRESELEEGLNGLRRAARDDPGRREILEFAAHLGEVVASRRSEIDALIGDAAHGWSLERMPAVDRAVLRLATAELLVDVETPTAVIIAEAGNLGGDYSTEQSRGFIQGVLGSVAKSVRPSH